LEPVDARLDFSNICAEIFAAGPGDDDSASRRAEAQSAADVDRRRGPAGEMVFRAEGGTAGIATNRCGDGASDEWASDFALAVLRRSKIETRKSKKGQQTWFEVVAPTSRVSASYEVSL
jgi:hypothetical protein